MPELRSEFLMQLGAELDDAQVLRTTLGFETGSERHRWLNRLVAVGVGRRTAAGMVTDIFVVK